MGAPPLRGACHPKLKAFSTPRHSDRVFPDRPPIHTVVDRSLDGLNRFSTVLSILVGVSPVLDVQLGELACGFQSATRVDSLAGVRFALVSAEPWRVPGG